MMILQERTPAPGASVTVIPREEIERSQAPFVLDLLRSVPGLHVVQAGGPGDTAAVFARGANAAQTVVLIDGARFQGDLLPPGFAHLSTAGIERIEIERGPLSAFAGSAAAGAIIRITTRSSGPLISALAEYGSGDTAHYRASSGAGSAGNHYSIAYDHYQTGDVPGSNEARTNSLSANLGFMITPSTSAAVLYRDIDANNRILAGPGAPDTYDPYDSRWKLLSVPVQQQIGRQLILKAEYRMFRQDQEEITSSTDTYSFSGHYTPATGHDITAGYEREDLETEFLQAPIGSKRADNAFFLDYRWTASPVFQMDAALRTDNDNVPGTRLSPHVSAFYKWQDRIRIHGSAGNAYRRTGAEEWVAPENRRETARGFDLGADWIGAAAWSASAVLFSTRYERPQLSGIPDEATSRIAYTATGLELQGEARPWAGWTFRGAYTLTNSEDDAPTPRNEASLGIRYARDRVQATIDTYLVGSSALTQSHTRIDAAIGCRIWKNAQIYGRITNLLDATYEEVLYIPARGRAAYVGLRWN